MPVVCARRDHRLAFPAAALRRVDRFCRVARHFDTPALILAT
jgi:hypothetical protein